MSHTPGPWKVFKAIFDAEDGEVGYVLEGVKESRSDDAALIEAAPELLEALEIAKGIIDNYIDKPVIAGYSQIKDAIEKARGEE